MFYSVFSSIFTSTTAQPTTSLTLQKKNPHTDATLSRSAQTRIYRITQTMMRMCLRTHLSGKPTRNELEKWRIKGVKNMREIISYLPPCWIRGWLWVLARRRRDRRVSIARQQLRQTLGRRFRRREAATYCFVGNVLQAVAFCSRGPFPVCEIHLEFLHSSILISLLIL